MSCYTRHLGEFIGELGLEDSRDSRRESLESSRDSRRLLDKALREALGYSKKEGCPLVWEEVKRWLKDPQLKKELLAKVKKFLEG